MSLFQALPHYSELARLMLDNKPFKTRKELPVRQKSGAADSIVPLAIEKLQ